MKTSTTAALFAIVAAAGAAHASTPALAPTPGSTTAPMQAQIIPVPSAGSAALAGLGLFCITTRRRTR